MDNRKVIYLDDAINVLELKKDKKAKGDIGGFYNTIIQNDIDALKALPPAQSETSRIENALHGKSAEEQYDFIWWLIGIYGMQFTDSRRAAIEWLKGEIN